MDNESVIYLGRELNKATIPALYYTMAISGLLSCVLLLSNTVCSGRNITIDHAQEDETVLSYNPSGAWQPNNTALVGAQTISAARDTTEVVTRTGPGPNIVLYFDGECCARAMVAETKLNTRLIESATAIYIFGVLNASISQSYGFTIDGLPQESFDSTASDATTIMANYPFFVNTNVSNIHSPYGSHLEHVLLIQDISGNMQFQSAIYT